MEPEGLPGRAQQSLGCRDHGKVISLSLVTDPSPCSEIAPREGVRCKQRAVARRTGGPRTCHREPEKERGEGKVADGDSCILVGLQGAGAQPECSGRA